MKSGTLIPSNARQSFGEGSVAMCIGHRWYAYGYAKLIKAGDFGLAPLPRDPDADKYYTAEEGGGFLGGYIYKACKREPWETISAKLAPKIDAIIKALYESK